jgi:hypothetical protein
MISKRSKGGMRAWCEEEPDIEWVLFTRARVDSYIEALDIVTIYKHRWLIEEYHKCIKTGCQIEKVQLKTGSRLLVLFGMIGVIATQILQLKTVSRVHPEEPAEKYVSKESIAVLQHIYKIKKPLTVKEYWRRVAMLAGFMGRKSDGDPGWQKIWAGWMKLKDWCRGMEIGRELRMNDS